MFPYNILLNIKSGITPVKSRDSATLFLFNCRRWDYVENAITILSYDALLHFIHYLSYISFLINYLFIHNLPRTYLYIVHSSYPFQDGSSTLARNKNYYKPQKCGLFYVKFYLFLCCTGLYFLFICDIMRYETQL